MFRLSSPAFNDGDMIPDDFTDYGMERSPTLVWENAPSGTQSFALLCVNPKTGVGVWTHWIIWNIPSDAEKLPEGMPIDELLPAGVRQGVNSFRMTGYRGPKPHRDRVRRYIFTIYALDTMLDLPAQTKRYRFQRAIRGHVLAEASLTGKYCHPKSRTTSTVI